MNRVRSIYPDLPEQVTVIDCTLRDGEQAPGVWFTREEKLALARLLSGAGVDVLDAGFPASSEADSEALQEMRRMRLDARIGATARPVTQDVVAAEKARADEVFLFMPTSDFRITQTLGITREEAGAMFRHGAEEVVGRGMTLNLVFEDATRADPWLLVQMTDDLRQHVPITRVIVADTVGCAHPRSMEILVRQMIEALGDDVELCTHCHNDFGFAAANTLAGVAAGARAITCTVNGIGERAGNADLAETVAALTHLYDVAHRVDPTALPRISAEVARMSGIHTSPTKPVTGSNVYRHESGVHVDGMLKDPKSYEFLPAAWVGEKTRYVLGKHSGTALIKHILKSAGIDADSAWVRELLLEVKSAAEGRDKANHQRAYQLRTAFESINLAGLDPELLLEKAVPRKLNAAASSVR